ncbi:glycosyl transferase, group 2 family protein, putative [Heliomicrobium modesticaldum Ice1]|uniref:Glycosyl transferase, group 2 family protein, putative n=1 Tax=Heliobacterium modesticaldum (strain ATCC 51547 / Ice1) TaxID=498761 RepID=B0TH18_HELMI|nr:glycosyltransferase family 2 protein [Heliomicrobium modesticaldum]ABZ83343.1 glycosyl transferase, group 2 family protein, putative [Heliomicrobium modesticaldum Ice1]
MAHPVAVVICNWNKKEDLLACIDAVLASRFRGFDLCVVDNASTDGSAEAVAAAYGDQVILLRNEQNLGGAGGFNRGIRWALSQAYEYIHLLDNDVFVEADAIGALHVFMEEHPDVAAAGSRLYKHAHPNQLQELGANIDWERFHLKPHFKNHIDRGDLPDIMECDYVPACSVMLRADVLRKVGLMDEGCFIYWDDVEWFYRMRRLGRRVVAFAGSKAWHKMGAAVRKNTFATYYFWRNRIHFFARALDGGTLERFAEALCAELAQAAFFSEYKGQHNTVKTLFMAVADALTGTRGQAGPERIFERESEQNRLAEVFQATEQVVLLDCGDIRVLREIVNGMLAAKPGLRLSLASRELPAAELALQFPAHPVMEGVPDADRSFLLCQTCRQIADVRHELSEQVGLYVDAYMNVVHSEEDRRALQRYDQVYQGYIARFLPVLRQKLIDLGKSRRQRVQETQPGRKAADVI